jgi:hypothetical protein
MSSHLLKIISVFLACTIKFGLVGVPAAVAAGFPFFKAVTITAAGGIAGSFFFTFLSVWILKGMKKVRGKIVKNPKKKFTRFNRAIIKVKWRFGLLGIAIITPPILSMPLGCFLAVRYYSHRQQQILIYMSISVLGWAVILFFFWKNIHDLIFN